jgi:hypothetical protein
MGIVTQTVTKTEAVLYKKMVSTDLFWSVKRNIGISAREFCILPYTARICEHLTGNEHIQLQEKTDEPFQLLFPKCLVK